LLVVLLAFAVPALAHQGWIVRTWGKAGTPRGLRRLGTGLDNAVLVEGG
jgi:hypothetical protein